MASEPIVIGGDWDAVLDGAQDSSTGDYLDTATVTFALYDATGVAVSGGSGTCSYVTASDGKYIGVVESTITATLTDGAQYEVRYVLVQGAYNAAYSEWTVAQSPGAPLIDSVIWQEVTGVSLSTTDLASVRRAAAAVTGALTRKCYPILLRPMTLTMFAFDAPPTPSLLLPRPIRSITGIWYHSGAGGDSTVVDLVADKLVAGVDYQSKASDVLTGWNRTGEVIRLNCSSWGARTVRPIGSLGYRLEAEPGSVFVSAQMGPTAVNPAAQEAAAEAVTLLFQRRKTGAPLQSEAFGGYSYSLAAPFAAEAAVNSPGVIGTLRDAGLLPVHVGGGN